MIKIKNKTSSKRNLLSVLCFLMLSIQVFIANALSVYAGNCGPAIGIPCNPLEGKISTLLDAVVAVTLYLLSLIGLVALFFIVFAGIKYIFSIGDEEKMKSAKSAFSSAILGLAIALMAYGILFVINYILNG